MKIRADYVTNSSSTSYIIICDGNFTEDDFAEIMGIQKNSPLFVLVISLYGATKASIGHPKLAWELRDKYGGDFQAFVKDRFSDEVWLKVVEARKRGKAVHVGLLSSGESEAEDLFCRDSFE